NLLGGMDVHRDAAAVVLDGDDVTLVHGDPHARAEAGHRLVDRVVHDLVHEVVEPAPGGRADVHPGPLAHGVEALEHRDLAGRVVGVLLLLFFLLVRHARLGQRSGWPSTKTSRSSSAPSSPAFTRRRISPFISSSSISHALERTSTNNVP